MAAGNRVVRKVIFIFLVWLATIFGSYFIIKSSEEDSIVTTTNPRYDVVYEDENGVEHVHQANLSETEAEVELCRLCNEGVEAYLKDALLYGRGVIRVEDEEPLHEFHCECGFMWPAGQSGSHCCTPYLQRKIEHLMMIVGPLRAQADKYSDLILQVQNKIPGESRHDTAKRIIRQHESPDTSPRQIMDSILEAEAREAPNPISDDYFQRD